MVNSIIPGHTVILKMGSYEGLVDCNMMGNSLGIVAGQPHDFLAFVQKYSICDLKASFSSTIMPAIFFVFFVLFDHRVINCDFSLECLFLFDVSMVNFEFIMTLSLRYLFNELVFHAFQLAYPWFCIFCY